MKDNIKKRDSMRDLHGMKESELESLYNEYNLVISKAKAQIGIGAPLEKGQHKDLVRAKKMRARVLTILNQRRNKRSLKTNERLKEVQQY